MRTPSSKDPATADSGTTTDPSTLSYEEARDELVEVVRLLESGQSTLEESLALWERGEALAARCTQWLDGAQARIDRARRPAETEAAPSAETDTATPPEAGKE